VVEFIIETELSLELRFELIWLQLVPLSVERIISPLAPTAIMVLVPGKYPQDSTLLPIGLGFSHDQLSWENIVMLTKKSNIVQ
jgi:hypothetical protein